MSRTVKNQVFMENATNELKGYLEKGPDTNDPRAYFFCQSIADLKMGDEIVVYGWNDVSLLLDVMPDAEVEAVEGIEDAFFVIPPIRSTYQKKSRERDYN